jgi:L-Ala-D/L-Glu epimerase
MRFIQRVQARPVVRPLKTVFTTALGSKSYINNVLVTIFLDDGITGTGEIPTSFSCPQETVDAIGRVLREAAPYLVGLPIDLYQEKIEELRRTFSEARMTMSGLEVALFRAYLTSRGESEFAYWGGAERSLESDITIPFSSDHNSIRLWLRKAVSSGFKAFKCKVSGNLSEDFRFISLIQSFLDEAAPETPKLRLDGNQGFSRDSCLIFTDMLYEAGIAVELFEQPLPREDLHGLAYVNRRTPIPIILDESVYSVETLRRAVESGACDGVNIKVAKSGIFESRRIIEIARQEGIKLMIGCMMETMTGLSAAVYLAGGSNVFDFIDLDSVYFLYHRRRYGDISIKAPLFHIGQPGL